MAVPGNPEISRPWDFMSLAGSSESLNFLRTHSTEKRFSILKLVTLHHIQFDFDLGDENSENEKISCSMVYCRKNIIFCNNGKYNFITSVISL